MNTTPKSKTKAQVAREAYLERRGYDFSHTSHDGNPVLALRAKKVWVEILRDGSYRPA